MKTINPLADGFKSLILSIKVKVVLKRMDTAYNDSFKKEFERHEKDYQKAEDARKSALLDSLDYLGEEGKLALLNYYCYTLKCMDYHEQKDSIKIVNYLFKFISNTERLSKTLIIIRDADKIRVDKLDVVINFGDFDKIGFSKIMEIPKESFVS